MREAKSAHDADTVDLTEAVTEVRRKLAAFTEMGFRVPDLPRAAEPRGTKRVSR